LTSAGKAVEGFELNLLQPQQITKYVVFLRRRASIDLSKDWSGLLCHDFCPPGTRAAYKAATKRKVAESKALEKIYTLCNTDSFFELPRPLAFYEPDFESYLFSPNTSSHGSSPSIGCETLQSFEKKLIFPTKSPWQLLRTSILKSSKPTLGPNFAVCILGKYWADLPDSSIPR